MYTLVYIWLTIIPFSNADPITAIRNDLNKINSIEQADNYIEQLRDYSSIEARGYIAVLNFIKSREFKSPVKKIRYFNRACHMLDQLIESNPMHIELRYLRYSIQISTPTFLGYNKNLQNDLKFIKNEIQDSPVSSKIKAWILQNLLKLDNLSEIDRRKIELELTRIL